MAGWNFTIQELASFTGRPLASYTVAGEFANTSISMAALLLRLATGLTDVPADADKALLAKAGVLSYADHIILQQPFAKAMASPFNSESLGSYSYSKSAAGVQKGEATGVYWFDLAVSLLKVSSEKDSVLGSGGVEVFEHDGTFVAGALSNSRFLTPADVTLLNEYMSQETISRN